MTRELIVGAAQLGPIARADTRTDVVERLLRLMEQGKEQGCDLIVYPELALTTFFPRWFMENQQEVDVFFERDMPGPETQPLFDRARELGIGFHLGYAELAEEDGETRRFNTAILVDKTGEIVSKYRKIHLPGHAENEPSRPFQHLEKRYFEIGNLGWPVVRAFDGYMGMCICNDRRWPETWRVLGLQGVELAAVGYNTPYHNPPAPEHDRLSYLHNRIVMQSAAYQNGTWIVAVAKAGCEEGCDLIGGSCIIAPTGEIVAQCVSLGDELVTMRCDLDMGTSFKETIFNFELHRQPDQYRMIVERKGAIPPDA